VDQVDSACNVCIDDAPRFFEILIEKRMAETASRIRQEGIDLTALGGRVQLVDAFSRGQIRLNGFDFSAPVTKGSRRLLDLGFIGRNQKIVALLRAPPGQVRIRCP
jgi:hypothetical protein